MENLIKNFFDYLLYIGVTTNSTTSIIFQLLSTKYKDSLPINLDDLLISLISDYFKSLTKEQLESIGKNVYEQYINNKLSTKLKYLKKLFKIKYNYNKRKKRKYFNLWRLNAINTTTINKNNYFFRGVDKKSSLSDLSSSLNNFFDRMNFYDNKKTNLINNLKLMKEFDIKNKYTFTPNIPKKRDKKKNRKLYNILYEEYKEKSKPLNELSQKLFEERGFTFSPRLYLKNKYYKGIKMDFFERNQKLIDKKNENFKKFLDNQKNNNISVTKHSQKTKSSSLIFSNSNK